MGHWFLLALYVTLWAFGGLVGRVLSESDNLGLGKTAREMGTASVLKFCCLKYPEFLAHLLHMLYPLCLHSRSIWENKVYVLKNAEVLQRSNVHTMQQILGVICAPVFLENVSSWVTVKCFLNLESLICIDFSFLSAWKF